MRSLWIGGAILGLAAAWNAAAAASDTEDLSKRIGSDRAATIYVLKAEKAVEEHVAVKWTSAKLPDAACASETPDAVTAFAAAIPAVAEATKAGLPVLLFFSSSTLDSGRQKVDETKLKKRNVALRSSGDIKEEFFDAKDGEYRLPILAKFFRCVLVDVTGAQEKKNAVFLDEKAPAIVLLDNKGKAANVFIGASRCQFTPLSNAITALLQKQGVKNTNGLFTKLPPKYKDLSKALELVAKAEAAQAGEGEKKGKKKTPSLSHSSSDDSSSGANSLLAAQKMEYTARLAEYNLLKDAGVPEANLPEKPVMPTGK